MSESNSPGSPPTPAAMSELRVRAINTSAAELGVVSDFEYPSVFGVLMDWPISDNTATVVSFSDGSSSLYTTSTFGIIGGGGHQTVRKQARAFVKVAERFFDEGQPSTDTSYPEPDCVRFHLLTYDGVRVIDADAESVMSGNDPLSALFGQGQAVLTELRLCTQTDSERAAEPSGSLEAGSDVGGYVNCLLTSMAEGIFKSIEISASKRVPDLLKMTVGHEESHRWIKEQQFDFESIDPKVVIKLLKQTAGAGGLPFFTKRTYMPIVHARGDGDAVACIFDIVIRPWSRSVSVDLAPVDDPRVIGHQIAIDEKRQK